MGAYDQILSILLNSKTVPQLPTSANFEDVDILPFYKNSIGKMAGLPMSGLVKNPVISESYLGTVTTAGPTTTETEIIDFINSIGFTIGLGELKIININSLVDGSVMFNSFFYKPNQVGTYGNGNTVIPYSSLFKFNVQLLNSFDDVVVKIDLGDIGTDTIEDSINNGNEISLLANVVYVFEALISGVNSKYLYTGAQPIFIGGGNNPVTASNFIDITDDSVGVEWSEITGDQKDVNLIGFEDGKEGDVNDIEFLTKNLTTTSLVFFNGLFIARTGVNTLSTSRDGKFWMENTINVDINLIWVVGDRLLGRISYLHPKLYTSFDGLIWNEHNFTNRSIDQVSYMNGTTVLVNKDNPYSYLHTVVDNDFDNIAMDTLTVPSYSNHIQSGNGLFVFLYSNYTHSYYISTDGITWIEKNNMPVYNPDVKAFMFGNGKFIIVDPVSSILSDILSTSNGDTWQVDRVSMDSEKVVVGEFNKGVFIMVDGDGF